MADPLPADSDVDLRVARQRRELGTAPSVTLGVIAAGGALGASARYGLSIAVRSAETGFPWATFGVNVLGCLLLGALMVGVTYRWPERRLVRPFLGVGVLGGFTTFSTYVVEIQHLIEAGAAGTALAYLAGTVAAALPATWLGLTGARWLLRRSRPAAAKAVGR